MNKKRLLLIIGLLTLSFLLVACGSSTDDAEEAAEATADVAEEVVEESADVVEEAADDTGEPND